MLMEWHAVPLHFPKKKRDGNICFDTGEHRNVQKMTNMYITCILLNSQWIMTSLSLCIMPLPRWIYVLLRYPLSLCSHVCVLCLPSQRVTPLWEGRVGRRATQPTLHTNTSWSRFLQNSANWTILYPNSCCNCSLPNGKYDSWLPPRSLQNDMAYYRNWRKGWSAVAVTAQLLKPKYLPSKFDLQCIWTLEMQNLPLLPPLLSKWVHEYCTNLSKFHMHYFQ